jgi:hypothetical protein
VLKIISQQNSIFLLETNTTTSSNTKPISAPPLRHLRAAISIFQPAFRFLLQVSFGRQPSGFFVNIVDMVEITALSRDDSKEGSEQNMQQNSGFFGALGPDIRREFYRWALLVQEPTKLLRPKRNQFNRLENIYQELNLDFSNVNCALFTLNKFLSQETLEFFYTQNNFIGICTNSCNYTRKMLRTIIPSRTLIPYSILFLIACLRWIWSTTVCPFIFIPKRIVPIRLSGNLILLPFSMPSRLV